MKKHIEHASSTIANHYGLKWNGRSLTLKRWESVGCLSSLFFVSIHLDSSTHLYLVDRKEIDVEEEGMRLKLPCFHFSPQMVEELEKDRHQVWYMAVEGELILIRDHNVERLFKRLRIVKVGRERHRFDQDVLGTDFDIRQPYQPGRGRVRKDYWKNHLNRKTEPVLEPA